ncbi:hypothetical protein MHY85_03145 [Cellulomonas sp. ACRRI]|uniref:hypothetical protein n=1 Tax=Cellulomonas sp. ACRRI TaxID=2918188 RepID=UPI001EF30FA4|nr:hypothetical protein [Cellulomonas sp. ACRRI]MCG7284968.1 hypothetical protein [Cellulomonas sp. ACRRI]
MSQSTKQVRVVSQAAPARGQDFETTAFFDATGAPIKLTGAAGLIALTPVTTPDATDAASAVTLANALKVKVNAIIAALKA